MKTNVRWMGPGTMRFIADTGSGHLIGMDGAPEGGGDNLAARPMELMLAGAGGCTAYDVVLILKKGRHDVRGCQVQLEADRADTDPKVFTRIKLHFIVRGRKLNPAHVERAIKLSHDKTDPFSCRGRCTRHARPGAYDGQLPPWPVLYQGPAYLPPNGTSHLAPAPTSAPSCRLDQPPWPRKQHSHPRPSPEPNLPGNTGH